MYEAITAGRRPSSIAYVSTQSHILVRVRLHTCSHASGIQDNWITTYWYKYWKIYNMLEVRFVTAHCQIEVRLVRDHVISLAKATYYTYMGRVF